jgi:phosphate transport system protein
MEGNRKLAYSVILRDQYIDALEKELDQLCLQFLVRQQPVAGHLRFVYAAFKINQELERIGDYAESISRQVLVVSQLEEPPDFSKFEQIAHLSIPMLHDAIQAFVDQNPDLARTTMEIENQADEVRDRINEELFQLRQEGKLPLEALTPLMTIARRYERVADQSKNICEEVLYMCTGEYAKHKGTKTIRILFVGEGNACRSQMAEAIAESLKKPQFEIASAGIDPQPLDEETVRFMGEKGIDISGRHPKSLEEIGKLEDYEVVVVFGEAKEKAFPKPPSKTVGLDWTIPDPSRRTGTPAEIRAAYEEAYEYLRTQILDLVQAILGEEISKTQSS